MTLGTPGVFFVVLPHRYACHAWGCGVIALRWGARANFLRLPIAGKTVDPVDRVGKLCVVLIAWDLYNAEFGKYNASEVWP